MGGPSRRCRHGAPVLLLLLLLLLTTQYAAARTAAGSRKISIRGRGNSVVAAAAKAESKGNSNVKEDKASPLSLFVAAFRLSFRQGLSGGAAGLVQVITMMWLRTTVTYQHRYGVSTSQALRELYAQGGVMRFYRGLSYAIVQAPLCRFGSVAANEISNILVGVPTGSSSAACRAKPSDARAQRSDYAKIVLAATLGSALSTMWRVLLMPLDTCKTVLQVDGAKGFSALMARVLAGDIAPLFRGTTATIVATWVGHSWFLVHNWLDAAIAVPPSANARVLRAAWIGFLASAVSDAVSNCIKVIKTVKQAMLVDEASGAAPSYAAVVRHVLAEGGLAGLLGRGLLTRVASNGLQSVVFTVLWKVLFTSAGAKAKAGARTGAITGAGASRQRVGQSIAN